ncbi:5-dehydro-4-deoxyglucarate dehydratase [Methylocapsa sp. S129]|uniref:5-dehydro-4-deoxyglucarate dehydratase n=1 Tax=Methylocapsa sp. S129 TaxID=1641869 RepID=UPI00131C4E41|nr:5-dehydro-4-deoxyglucarate dehydratase [Methylocapsa sp. S129]
MVSQHEHLKAVVGAGLLSFPVTHFTAAGAFDPENYRHHVADLLDHGPAALFAAGGTGEFFSLGLDEYESVIAAAVEAAGGRTPVIAGVGYGTTLAIEFARRAERAGANGILMLPPYLVQVEQEGLRRHVAALCGAVGIGVIVYHRDNCLFELETLRLLCDAHPNLIGFKDGHGNVEQLTCIRTILGDRLVYVGGMPTAEVYANANHGIGISTYSSAVFNFIPEFAMRFHAAVQAQDSAFTSQALRRFFVPYLAIRNRRRGYAVSIVKAGLRVVGRPAGPVRSPLVDLTPEEEGFLAALVENTTRQ